MMIKLLIRVIIIFVIVIIGLLVANSVQAQNYNSIFNEPTMTISPFIGYQDQDIKIMSHDYIKENNSIGKDLVWGVGAQVYENRTYLTINALFQTDIINWETYQSAWDFIADYKVFKDNLLFVQLKLHADQNLETTNHYDKIYGTTTSLGLQYNNTSNQQEYNNLVNFYGQADYIFWGKQKFLTPPYLEINFNKSIKSTVGVIVNLWDIVFFEQNVVVFTKPRGWIQMTPYFSYFDTKVWVELNDLSIGYTHTCYHTFKNDLDWVNYSGLNDVVSMQYTLQW